MGMREEMIEVKLPVDWEWLSVSEADQGFEITDADGKSISPNTIVELLNTRANTRDRWVAVEERLPEGKTQCEAIGSLLNGYVASVLYSHFSNRWLFTDGTAVTAENPVIAWQPLPEPFTYTPQEGGENAS